MKENEELKKKIAKNNPYELNFNLLSIGKDKYCIQYIRLIESGSGHVGGKDEYIEVSWDDIFKILGSELYNQNLLETYEIENLLNSFICRKIVGIYSAVEIKKECLTQILVQFESLGYILKNVNSFWYLTNNGKKYFLCLISVKNEIKQSNE